MTDITYIRTWQGWLYLAVVMDLFSRLIAGWAAGPSIHRELVLNAVLSAVRQRRPRGTLIQRAATAISAASARRHLNVPRCEATRCLRYRGKSTSRLKRSAIMMAELGPSRSEAI